MRNTKVRKQILSWILVAGLMISSLSGVLIGNATKVQAAENTAPGKPTDLKTEMLEEAYGVDTKNPAFSWVVNDKDKDEIQSAYRIRVSQSSALKGDVYDSDWVKSSESSFVHVPELEDILEDNQLYYWQVQTKDKAGASSELSEAAPFMTDIASEWQSMNGIWAKKESVSGLWKDYTAEMTVSITAGNALAVMMRVDGSNTGYMLQLRDADNVIKCHHIANGTVNTTAFQTLSLSGSGITLPTNQSEFKVRFVAKGSAIDVEIDTNANDGTDTFKSAGTVDLTKATSVVSAGMIGFRTGRYESGTIDNMTVTDSNGTVLYTSDFASEDGSFNGLKVSGGKLSVGVSAFSVYSNPNNLTQLGNFSFFRSPYIHIADKAAVDKAIISASCRGTAMDRGVIFDLYFNGSCIGAGSARELANVGTANGKTGYTKVYYNSYDVTKLLAEGDENVISAVGNCRDSNRGILVQMTVFYKDGTKEILTNSGVSNSGWKTLEGTNAFGDKGGLIDTGYVKLLQENINGEMYPTGWQNVDYDDSSWKEAKTTVAVADQKTGSRGRVLYPHSSENALRIETDEPTKKIYKNANGNIVVDLGKEIIGGMKIHITSNKRQNVTVHMGEEMYADGTVKYQLSAVPDYEDFWTLKAGENVFDTVTMRNFRYVEFIGLDNATKENMLADKDCIKGWAIQQTFDETDSSFLAMGSDEAELLNRLYTFCKYTIKATNQDLFVDSQARERAAYEGDLLVNSNTSYAVSNNYSLARHSNEWLMDNPTWPNDYRLFSVEMAYMDYIYTGNTDSIEENYEALKKKLTQEVEYEDSATGLIRANDSQAGKTALIDWPTSERDGYTGSYYDVVFNAEYVGIYQNMASICEALGETEDAEYYRDKSELLKETLLEKAYDEEHGCFYDSLAQNYAPTKHSSTHATAYALAYGVYDSQEMADAMCEFVYNNCEEQFKGSVYVTYFILKGLYVGNHGEMAQKLMTNPKVGKDVKTFASLLDNLNCTITPEAWGHNWKNNMTLSHPWGASPGCSIVQGMFGIMPTEAGFDEFSIKLQPGGIPSASIKAPSVKGPVAVSYMHGSEKDLAEDKLVAQVTIPANSKAVVSLPVSIKGGNYLWVDGQKMDAKYDGDYLSVTLGSGTHAVSVGEENPYTQKEEDKEENKEPNKDQNKDENKESSKDQVVTPKPTPETENVTPTVELNAKSLPLQVKKSTNALKASGLITGDKVVKWISSKPSIATVTNSGKIKAKKVGTTIITVTTEKGATASCTIKVQKKLVKTKKLTVTNVKKNKVTLQKKKSLTLKVERNPLTATDKLTYTSSKKSIATVNNKGKVTAKKKGKAVITIKSANGKKVKVTVNVK